MFVHRPFSRVKRQSWIREKAGPPSGSEWMRTFRVSMPFPLRGSLIVTLKKIWNLAAFDGDVVLLRHKKRKELLSYGAALQE